VAEPGFRKHGQPYGKDPPWNLAAAMSAWRFAEKGAGFRRCGPRWTGRSVALVPAAP
jgi:hypothetical protein